MESSSELVLNHNFPLMGGIARVIAPCLFQLENPYHLLIWFILNQVFLICDGTYGDIC